MVLRWCLLATVVLVVLIEPSVSPAAATGAWPVFVTSSSAMSLAGPAPSTPTGVTSACASALLSSDITVTWAAASHATSYTVLQSTTSATSGFTSVATGVTSTSWTSGSLALGTYYYEVAADAGANWASPASSSTAGITVISVAGVGVACA